MIATTATRVAVAAIPVAAPNRQVVASPLVVRASSEAVSSGSLVADVVEARARCCRTRRRVLRTRS
jgi:hypothetical protein